MVYTFLDIVDFPDGFILPEMILYILEEAKKCIRQKDICEDFRGPYISVFDVTIYLGE